MPTRLIRALDPAQPGFVRRLARMAAFGALALAAIGCIGFFVLVSRVDMVAYWLGVAQLEARMPGLAARTAEDLVERSPDSDYRFYRLLATAYRREGRIEEQLAVFDRASQSFPRDWYAQGHHCWYHTLFTPEAPPPASCERAAELAPLDRGSAHAWRAVARGRAGDPEGAAEDLREALARWDRRGRSRGGMIETRRRWLEALEAGENPFDEAMMERERRRF